MATIDIKYLTQPHDGTPGTPWDDFEERILSVAAGKTDDRGWSLADVFNGVDEGAAGGPPVHLRVDTPPCSVQSLRRALLQRGDSCVPPWRPCVGNTAVAVSHLLPHRRACRTQLTCSTPHVQ